MIIREIRESDAEAFLQLLNHVDESGTMLFAPGERKSTVEKEKGRINRFLEDSKSVIIVAEENEQLAGYMMALGNHLRRTAHSAYLVVGVHESFRGIGVGKSMFAHVIDWANENNLKRLELTVIQSNERALHLYKKIGFVIEGERIGSLIIEGQPVNEYYMYKWLK